MNNALFSTATRRISRRFILENSIARVLATALTCAAAHAATLSWDISPGIVGPGDSAITGGGGTWDLANGNWTSDGGVNNVAWVNNVLPDSAVFGGAAGAITLGAAITANALTFDTAGYGLSGNVLTLAGATPSITTNADASIDSVLAGTGGFTKLGAGQLTLGGAGSNTFTGTTIVDRGTLVLGKTGGAFAIVGNVQMGGTVGNQPNLRMAANEQFGAGVVMTFVNPAGSFPRFDLQGTTQTLAGVADATGAGVIQNEKFGGGGTSGPATLTLNASAGSLSFNGYMRDRDSGPGIFLLNLVKSGAGTQELAGGNITYTGTTTVNDGTLRLTDTTGFASDVAVAAPGTLNLNTGGAMSFGRVIGGTGTVLRTGGTMTINGAASNTFSGTTIIDSGTTILAKTGGATAIAGTVQMGGGNGNQPNLRMGADNQFAAGTVMTTANVAGNWTRFDLLGTSQTLAGAQDLNGGLVIQNGGIGVGSAVDATITFANATDFTLNSHIRDFDDVNGGGKLNLIKNSAGTLTLGRVPGVGAAVSYTGTTSVDGGRLELLNGTAFASATTINPGGVFRISNDLASSPYSPLGGGAAIVVNAGGVLELNNATTGYDNRKTLSGSVSGAGTINVIGTGYMALPSVDNITLSGRINVLSGGLGNDSGNSANAFGATTAALDISAGAFFDMRGGAPQFREMWGGGVMMNSWTANVLTVGVSDGSGTFTGTMQNGGNGITGTGGGGGSVLSLTKVGTGTQTLGVENAAGSGITYTGDTTVSGGTLAIIDGRLVTAAKTVAAGATLEIRSTIPFALRWNNSGTISGAGTMNKTGSGVFGTTGAVTFTGTINILEGRIHNDNVTGNWTGSTADVNISAPGVLDLRANDIYVDELNGTGEVWNSHPAGGGDVLFVGVAGGSSSYGGVIRGDGSEVFDNPNGGVLSLTKQGAGIFTLTGANIYSGTTSVTGGTLQVGNGGATGNLGTGAVTNNAALVFNRSGTSTVNNAIGGTGTLGKLGTGLVVLAGNPSHTGATTVTDGTLAVLDGTAWNSDASVASPGVFAVANSGSGTWNYTKAVTGNGTFAKGGAGTVRVLNNLATYTGPTHVETGVLQFHDATAFASSGITVASGGYFEMNRSGGSQTLSAPVSGAGHFTKSGAGEVVLGAALTNSGNTSVRAGTLTATAANQLSASGTLSVGGSGAAAVRLNGYSQTVGGLAGGLNADARIVNGSATPAALTVNLASGQSVFGGALGGPGADENNLGLVKQGAGTLVLSGQSTHTGGLTISGGTVQLGASTTLPVSSSSLGIWLDGADPNATGIAPADGASISTWKNKGALGATGDFGAEAGREPSYGSAGAGLMNGNATVRFTADAVAGFGDQVNFDKLTNAIDLASGPSTILVAGRYAGGSGDERKRLVSALSNNWLLGWWNNGINGAYYTESAGFVPGVTTADTAAHTYTAIHRGDGAADTYGEAGRLGSIGAGAVGPIGLALGGGSNYANPNRENSTGDVGELIVVQGILSDADRAAIEAYLARKWTGYIPTNPLATTSAVNLTASGATLAINGVTQTLGSLSGVAGSAVTLGGGSLTVGDASSTVFAGAITGSGGFTKVGSGTLELSGASTPSGNPVFVQGGTLLITGSLSGSTVEVQSGGTLGGNGTIGSDVYILAGGKLSPGTSPGTLTITGTQLDVGDAVFGTNTQALVFELGTVSDRVNITTGQFGLGLGVMEFDDFAFTAGIGFGPGTYTLFDSTQDVFGSLGANLAGTIGAFGATLSLADTDNDLVLTVVPEPGSAALLLAGLACFGLRRRRN